MEAAGTRFVSYVRSDSKFKVWLLSDLHLMNKNCAIKEIKSDIKKIQKDPHSIWIGGGDYVDYIGYTDKRFDPDSVSEDVSVSDLGQLGQRGIELCSEIFFPIKEKCLGLLLGNHEKKYQLKNEQEDLHDRLCDNLEIRNLGYSCLIDLSFIKNKEWASGLIPQEIEEPDGPKETFRIFAHHGAGYAQTPGGKMNRLIQFMNSFRADIYFCGHVHDKIARREPQLGANTLCNKIISHDRLGVISGSYLKTYEEGTCSYGEQRGYRPTSLGGIYIEIKPDNRELSAKI